MVGGGGGGIHSRIFLVKNGYLNKSFTICKHKNLLLQLSGWFLMNIKVTYALALTTFSLNRASVL